MLQAHILAVAALAGAALFVAVLRVGPSRPRAMALGGGLCFGLRVVAVWSDWNLPRPGAR